MNRIVVIDASWGGVQALQRLAGGLTPEFPAPVLAVLHIGNRPSRLPQVLSVPNGTPVSHPKTNELLHPGRMYVVPLDHHMLGQDDHIALNRGPKETSESVGRATVYLSCVSGALIAMGFLAPLLQGQAIFVQVSLALLGALFLLGIVTCVAEQAGMDIRVLRWIALYVAAVGVVTVAGLALIATVL